MAARSLRPHGSAVPTGVAFLVTDILRDVVDRVPRRRRLAGYRGPAASAPPTTPTTTGLPVHASRVGVVWIGADMPRPIIEGAAGDRVAPRLWGRIMRRIAPPGEPDWQPPPSVLELRIDDDGKVYGPDCDVDGAGRSDYFLASTVRDVTCGTPRPRLRSRARRVAADTLAIPAADTTRAMPTPDTLATPATDTLDIPASGSTRAIPTPDTLAVPATVPSAGR